MLGSRRALTIAYYEYTCHSHCRLLHVVSYISAHLMRVLVVQLPFPYFYIVYILINQVIRRCSLHGGPIYRTKVPCVLLLLFSGTFSDCVFCRLGGCMLVTLSVTFPSFDSNLFTPIFPLAQANLITSLLVHFGSLQSILLSKDSWFINWFDHLCSGLSDCGIILSSLFDYTSFNNGIRQLVSGPFAVTLLSCYWMQF